MPSQGKENMILTQKRIVIAIGVKIWIRIANYIKEIIQTERIHPK